jgi:hypothetical protein
MVGIAECPGAAGAQVMIIGNDEKVGWNDAGVPVFSPPGKDAILVVDIGASPEAPKTVYPG